MQEKLLILRNRCHYSQKYVADYLGITAKQYGYKEKGEYAFNADEMFKLGVLFNENISNLFLPRGNQNGDKNAIT